MAEPIKPQFEIEHHGVIKHGLFDEKIVDAANKWPHHVTGRGVTPGDAYQGALDALYYAVSGSRWRELALPPEDETRFPSGNTPKLAPDHHDYVSIYY